MASGSSTPNRHAYTRTPGDHPADMFYGVFPRLPAFGCHVMSAAPPGHTHRPTRTPIQEQQQTL
eukprot:1159827-Pelagomonas_calceolata.AAC.8